MRKRVKGNVSWVCYIDWELESFHGDDYSFMTGDNILFSNDAFGCYGWSGESVKLLQTKLAEAGFDVIDENIRSQWNSEENDLAGIPALVTGLIVKAEETV